ncbi:MAG: hypothetical protein RJA55_1057 [Acidobacteriota bacterium]
MNKQILLASRPRGEATAAGDLVVGMVATGTLKYRESIAHGIESAPEAFLGLLKGKNFGQQLVKL